MLLTLKNYIKVLPKELAQLAQKNTVRECDEMGKGHFVAYVDEGNSSFDVSLTVLTNGEISESTCDCTSNVTFCQHKTALLIHIAKGKKIESAVKLTKKESITENLLDQADFNELKNWVKILIGKNKDIELAFNHHFSAKKQRYTPEEVVKLIKESVKATIGNKKAVDATQLKKLVELWSEVLLPVVEEYQANVMDEQAFQSLHTMVEHCRQFQSSINSSSNRITKFIDDVLLKVEALLNGLLNDGAWHKATGFFVAQIPGGNNTRLHYLLLLQNILVATVGERRLTLIGLLTAQFKKSKPEDIINGALYTKSIFKIIETYSLFPQYYGLFKPLHFDNEFNQKLINLLIENKHLDLAKKFCEQQIKNNFREEYNVPYLKLLKEIYTIEHDELNLAKVLLVLFPYSFDFDDYLFIIDRLPADEKKNWRTKVLSKARNLSRNYNSNAVEFCFKLMDYEKSYKKMIDYIDSYTSYNIILKYFEPMVLTEKDKLLNAIIKKSDSSWAYSGGSGKDDSCFPDLFDIAEKHYSADYLKMVINSIEKGKLYYYNRSNNFIEYAKRRLGIHR